MLAEAADKDHAKGGAVRFSTDARLGMLAAMAMSTNVEAHSVAAMGLATMTNAADANVPMIAKVALESLVRLGRSAKPDTQAAALDALAALAELPDVQVDLEIGRAHV